MKAIFGLAWAVAEDIEICVSRVERKAITLHLAESSIYAAFGTTGSTTRAYRCGLKLARMITDLAGCEQLTNGELFTPWKSLDSQQGLMLLGR